MSKVRGRVAFSVEVAFICDGLFPVNVELSLFDAIFHPVDAHIGTFEIFGSHGVVQDAVGCSIVSLGTGGRLWVIHIFECLTEKNSPRTGSCASCGDSRELANDVLGGDDVRSSDASRNSCVSNIDLRENSNDSVGNALKVAWLGGPTRGVASKSGGN